jgi:hypothetical protein
MNNNTDILNELKEISPILLHLKENEQLLIIPIGYFEQLADNCMAEINTTSGLLASVKKENIKVPANYFDTFGDTIVAKIKEQEHTISSGKIIELPAQETKVFQLIKKVAFAAAVVGAVFLVKEVQQPAVLENNCEDGIACLTQEEIYQYMNANSHEFDVQQIQETVEPTLDTITVDYTIEKQDATQYIEENKLILEFDESSTDIF